MKLYTLAAFEIMERWAISIDIEGFGATYGDAALQPMKSLRALMDGIFRIGNRCYPESPDRLFAHQVGDGFIIVGEFGSHRLNTPVFISIALMGHLLLNGGIGKSAIAEGEHADIKGCYPANVLEARDSAGRVRLGRGVMTIFTIMGTALIRSVGLANEITGPLLVLREADASRVPSGVPTEPIQDTDLVAIDWIHAEHEELTHLRDTAGLDVPTASRLERAAHSYLATPKLKPRWVQNARRYLNL